VSAVTKPGSSRGRWLATLSACAWALGGCAAGDLGECNQAAAQELVFSASGMVATKGQALAHDSCGNGGFCHSAAARGNERHGAPAGMDFDMLPSPTGLDELLERADTAWGVVEGGDMPPGAVGDEVMGDGQWTVDVTGLGADAPALPSLKTTEGKAAFRNWLACGAPSVTDTGVPSWARAPMLDVDGGTGFQAIHTGILEPRCAVAGCHTDTTRAGGLSLEEPCAAHAALLGSGTCGKTYVRAGDAAASFLVEKLEMEKPSCGGSMPPTGQLPEGLRSAIRSWIDAGAEGPSCP
jgi:hypothetical protein